MSIGKDKKIGLIGVGILGLTALGVACFDPPEKNSNKAPLQAGACKAEPGTFPEPGCDDSDNVCDQTACTTISEATCGSTSTCMPLSDNAGKSTVDLRIRKLYVISPPTLATPLIRSTVITKNIDLNATQCGENGAGSFNWLLRVDKTANTLETGGAPPTADPTGLGYCFYNHVTPGGIDVAPAKTSVTFEGDTFTSAPIPKLNVPIFLNGDVTNAIILPLSEVVINKTKLSDGNNCVGNFDLKALDSDCQEDPAVCVKWKTNASLGGFITLEEADKVDVVDLGSSLCVVLTLADGGGSGIRRCPRGGDGKLALSEAQQGDYCSETQQPGGCRDSFWLTATFAASAAKIHDGAGVEQCGR